MKFSIIPLIFISTCTLAQRFNHDIWTGMRFKKESIVLELHINNKTDVTSFMHSDARICTDRNSLKPRFNIVMMDENGNPLPLRSSLASSKEGEDLPELETSPKEQLILKKKGKRTMKLIIPKHYWSFERGKKYKVAVYYIPAEEGLKIKNTEIAQAEKLELIVGPFKAAEK